MLLALILSVVAFINATYLTYLKLTSTDSCLLGNSCNDVINSTYGSILGIPVSYIGMVFFTCVIYLIYQYKFKKSVKLIHISYLLLIGSIASFIFLIIQFFILKSFCLFCTFSAIFTVTITILCFYNLQQSNSSELTNRRHVVIVGLIVFTFAIFHFIPKLFLDNYLIRIEPKTIAFSSYKNFSKQELDDIAGLDYYKNQNLLFELRERTFFNELLRQDAMDMKLSLNQYLGIFVERNFSLKDIDVVKRIKSFNGNTKQITAFLNANTKVNQQLMRSKYQNLRVDIFNKYEATITQTKQHKIFIQPNPLKTITIGKKSAPLSVIVFSDFKCSHCATFHFELDELLKKYSDYFYVEYRHFAHMGNLSETLALFSYCTFQQSDKNEQYFNKFADNVYANQKKVTSDTLNDYIPIAPSFNLKAFESCIKDSNTKNALKADFQEARRLNIKSTPTVFLNGYFSNMTNIKTELNKLIR